MQVRSPSSLLLAAGSVVLVSACTPQFNNTTDPAGSASPSPSASSDATTTTTVAAAATTTTTVAAAATTTTTVATTTTTVLSSDAFVLGQPDMATNRKYKNGMNQPMSIHTDGTKLYLTDKVNSRVLIWNSIPTTNSSLPDRVLGQNSLSVAGLIRAGNSANVANGLNNPAGVWSDGTKVVVTDTVSSRILIWNSFPTADGQNADVVLSAADMTSNGGGLSASRVTSPRSIYSNGTKLIVADLGNNRVLIWNTFPTANDQAADVVLGQANMTSGTANAGTTVNSNTLSGPYGVYSDGTKLFIADTSNHRVLIWNTIPTVNQTAADVVLGQADMTSGSANRGGTRTAGTLWYPGSVSVSGTKLFVTDNVNNRVLIWDTIPTTNGANASWVVGQADMTSGGTGLTSSNLSNPTGVTATGTKLIVSEDNNNRALIWNSIPTSNGVAADVVLGQPNMTSAVANNDNLGTNGNGIAANTLPMPYHIFSDGSRTFVTEASSMQRVLIWNSATPSNGVAADVVVGQPDMTTGGNATSATGVSDPEGVASDGTRLFVADTGNNRITIWNSIPSTNGVAADVVLGQPDMTSSATGTSATTLNYPRSVQAVGGKLFAADYNNSRVLIWNSIPTSNQAAASVVVGQANMTSNVDGSISPTASTLSYVDSIYSDGTRLFVTDSFCYRILIWNSIPTTNGAAADLVLGAANMTTCGTEAVSSSQFTYPSGVCYTGSKLIVEDGNDNWSRLLIWNTLPTSNGQAADQVIGQASFITNVINYLGLTQNSYYGPLNIHCDSNRIYIPDTKNKRALAIPVP